MLPQFGYIVAQAGADARHPPSQSMYTTHSRSPPPTLSAQQQQQQQMKNQPTYNTTPTLPRESKPYYNAPPPPPPPPPRSPPHGSVSLHQITTTGPVLPPHPASNSFPYMYTNPASSHTGTNDYQPYYYSSNSNHYETSMKTQPVGDTGRSSRAAKNPWQQQQPHDLSMDHSYPPPPSMVWHNGSPSSHHHASLPHPIDPPSKSTNNNKMPATFDPSYYVKHQPPSSYPPTTSTFRWHQDDTPDLTETKMFRRTREYNDLMAWMDNEFWEQNDEVYQEKLQSLRKELESIQEGDHAAFQEMVADLELIRDQTIESALSFKNYQMTMTKQGFDLDVMLIEDEYKTDSQHLTELLALVIDEHRKQIKDDREATNYLDTTAIFQEVYERIQQKQNHRKRIGGDRSSSPRQETSSRGRRLKNTTVAPHNINAPLSSKEEEDIEAEYLAMKGVLPKRNGAASRR